MLEKMGWNWELDGWIVVVAILCAVAASVLGNFLVLRRMSMLGDAISHAVLPGLAAAFFISQSRSSLPMFLGAVVVGVLTAFFTEWIHRVGRVDEGAAMGVVFTSLFAAGLLLIVQAADHVDLDPSCVLYGAIELTPLDKILVGGFEIPRAAVTLACVALLNCGFVLLFYKELKLASFDPALSTTLGFNSSLLHYALMMLVAVTAVASFESVGNVLVVAMFVVPPATAYLLTDRLPVMIGLSIVIAILSAITGHIAAIGLPARFGYASTTTASMMAVAAGVFLFTAAFLGPKQGIIVRSVRRKFLSLQILADDMVAILFRLEEHSGGEAVELSRLQTLLLSSGWSTRWVAKWLVRRGEVLLQAATIELTQVGRARAQNLVRSHRLWEQYLQEHAGISVSRVHAPAERLEHFTDAELRTRLDAETSPTAMDPHGRPIPEEHAPDEHSAPNDTP